MHFSDWILDSKCNYTETIVRSIVTHDDIIEDCLLFWLIGGMRYTYRLYIKWFVRVGIWIMTTRSFIIFILYGHVNVTIKALTIL